MEDLKIVSKFGEVSNVKVHQVLGDPNWHSSPTIALEVHNRVKKHFAEKQPTKRK